MDVMNVYLNINVHHVQKIILYMEKDVFQMIILENKYVLIQKE